MAKPRIFVSSTYYDLKHIRSSLDIFIEDLGFESILSEKGDIAYSPDIPLDESCYREVETADVFVLIIGGRYGSEASGAEKKQSNHFFERYESITKKEYESALRKDTPTYILIETNVYSEYQTFLKNRNNENVVYAHVQSANIFHLIDEVLSKPRNNPIHTFERFSDIEEWLRDQWAGLFREMLNRRSQQQQLSALSLQVADLKETNSTMRKYLEAVMSGISPNDSTKLIESEQKRLAEVELKEKLLLNDWCAFAVKHLDVGADEIIRAFRNSDSYEGFTSELGKCSDNKLDLLRLDDTLSASPLARKDFNDARALLGLKPIKKLPEQKLKSSRATAKLDTAKDD